MTALARQKGGGIKTASTAIGSITNMNNNDNDKDDVISMESTALQAYSPPPNTHEQHIPLSKKALHQRDADENLFLRFLELDPPGEVAAALSSSVAVAQTSGNAAGGAGGSSASRPYLSKPLGRTPFTMTKKLTRTGERSFGFSIVWTHPPRVEKIEPGLSAERSGLLPGDYVIFVEKHNVVTMPEADVLNLIRSQGASLTLELFRRSASGGVGSGSSQIPPALCTATRTAARSTAVNSGSNLVMNGKTSRVGSAASNYCAMAGDGSAATVVRTFGAPASGSGGAVGVRPSTACSGTSSIEAAKRRLHLPQVTFSKESIAPITDNRRRFLLQLISREQNFISALHFGMQRFVQPLQERKDLISPNDHRTLFQNIDELLRISEDILEQLCNDDQEPQMSFASRVYLSKTTAICAAYKKYCNGIKRADCVLVNKSRQGGSEFINFITEPQVPRKRPDLCMLIHRPLQHFREILKLMQLLSSNCHVDSEEHKNFSSVIIELQAAYREITVSSGLMEPLGEGRPLLTLQDLESRMVFTKCKPFTLAVQGRQWIFGGDLSRVEGRSVKPYWTLLFSDIIVFAKVSRDRVLFVTEEPIPIVNIVDSCFHMRKKTTEFRLTVDPNGRLAESPTGYCAPDLTRTPKKNARRKSLVLRAPSLELKAVWQNLLQRQIFFVNAALGSTPLSSPLDSPDVLNTLVPLSDIGVVSASVGSIKLSSMDSINLRNQQQNNRQHHSLNNPADQIELLIDEKCRILNKTGTPKSSALHLANWMKGQLDKQQEQARLAAEQPRESSAREDEQLLHSDSDHDERITYWTRQQLEKRTKELNLIKEPGRLRSKPDFGGKRLSGVEELSMSDAYSENVSRLSQSHSTTSDSQITVRSSPNVLDKLAVCHHCHKHCQQIISQEQYPQGQELYALSSLPPNLLCNSLKVQHSQSPSHRCSGLNGGVGNGGSVSSTSSSTVTGEPSSEHSSPHLTASVGRGVLGGSECGGDRESYKARLLTDENEISQLEATNDDQQSTTAIGKCNLREGQRERSFCTSFNPIRILDEGPHSQRGIKISSTSGSQEVGTGLMNGYISSGISSMGGSGEHVKPEPPPRRLKIPQSITTTTTTALTTTTIQADLATDQMENTRPKTPKSPRPLQATLIPTSAAPFTACHCDCSPDDFEKSTTGPDQVKQQTCKLLESSKKSPMLLPSKANIADDLHKYCKCVCDNAKQTDISHDNCNIKETAFGQFGKVDRHLSETLVEIAHLTPSANLIKLATKLNKVGVQPPSDNKQTMASTTKALTSNSVTTPAEGIAAGIVDANCVPMIAVVPPTPDAVLSKTATNIWDNSTQAATSINNQHRAFQLHIDNVPRQPAIEHIPDDSCEDESPLDEEPPYRPMSSALRRYGTMSSLEKLPSDDRIEDGEVDELEDDGKFVDNIKNASPCTSLASKEFIKDDGGGDEFNDDVLEAELRDELEAQFEGSSDGEISLVNREVYDRRGTDLGSTSGASVWSRRAGSFVTGKMSFFEESRAFIDRYLGRWNQEQTSNFVQPGSEQDELLDECTSGATSGEEIWGTPTSGGETDEIQLLNSENTQSSPTKSSTSLNDDDDTELMMDELLMAPPMTASTIRGLLPRRRLEPLFEEETESDEEEKTQQESEELKKGEATTNGRDSADGAASSSDEGMELDTGTNPVKEEEQATSAEKHLQPDLPTILGLRPIRHPFAGIPIPIAVLRTPYDEYLFEQRSASLTESSYNDNSLSMIPASKESKDAIKQQQLPLRTIQLARGETHRKATMTAVSMHPAMTATISTTTSITNTTTCTSKYDSRKPRISTTVLRPAKFIPPPPPPRRLLLTQTTLKSSGNASLVVSQESSGVFADTGSLKGVAAAESSLTRDTSTQRLMRSQKEEVVEGVMKIQTTKTAAVIKNSVGSIESDVNRSASRIIETSLLGRVNQRQVSASSTTASTTKCQDHPSEEGTNNNNYNNNNQQQNQNVFSDTVQLPAGSALSPRLEMRLALNHDILGDEDLMCYDPGPDLTTILGHDLSTFHRLTGRDLLHRSATNRVQPKEAVISFSQQRNSKMDTPTVNRRHRPRPNPSLSTNSSSLLAASGRVASSSSSGGNGVALTKSPPLQNRNTWSSSVSVDRSADANASGTASIKSFNYKSDERKLSDLEILARREKIYCMSQSRSGSAATQTLDSVKTMTTKSSILYDPTQQQSAKRMMTTTTTSTTSWRQESDRREATGGSMRVGKVGRDETALSEAVKGNRLINFIKRRNSEDPISPNSQSFIHESNDRSTPEGRWVPMSPRKDNDKPPLNRRFWKQITKRRRANSVSEIFAN